MDEKYSKIHSLTLNNEELIRDKECICLYCGNELNYKDISDWIGDIDGLTAICPYCNIDGVVPKTMDDGYKITKDDIKEIKDIYF